MSSSEQRFNYKKSKLLFPQFGLKLERGIKQSCEICKTAYNVFKKEHICKRCFRSVCADCSPFKVKTYLANRNVRLHRNCVICSVQSAKIHQYIEENKLNFGKDSDLLYIWSKAMTDRKGVKVSRSKSNTNKYIDLDNLWGSFNFSFRQFIGRLIEKNNVNDADLINLISNGIQEIQYFFADSLQDGTYIYLFFLCHSDLETAVNLTLYLLELLNKTKNNKEVIKKLIQNIGFSEIEMYKIEEFLSDNELILKDSATVNILPLTATVQIINSAIVNKNLHLLWKIIMLLLFDRKEIVFKHLYKINIIIVDILRNPNLNFKGIKLMPEITSSDQGTRLASLMKDFQALKNKNEWLQKELNEKMEKEKMVNERILTDSIFNDDFLQKKEQCTSSCLQFKPQEFNQILQGKNEEIIKLKMKNEQLQQSNKEKTAETQNLYFQNQILKEQAAQKDQRLQQLQQQAKNLRGINQLLIQKMKELSKMLMDQEQKQIHQNQAVIEDIKDNYQQLTESKKEECDIY